MDTGGLQHLRRRPTNRCILPVSSSRFGRLDRCAVVSTIPPANDQFSLHSICPGFHRAPGHQSRHSGLSNNCSRSRLHLWMLGANKGGKARKPQSHSFLKNRRWVWLEVFGRGVEMRPSISRAVHDSSPEHTGATFCFVFARIKIKQPLPRGQSC